MKKDKQKVATVPSVEETVELIPEPTAKLVENPLVKTLYGIGGWLYTGEPYKLTDTERLAKNLH